MSEEVDKNEKNLVQQTFLMSSVLLRGGDKHTIDELYSEYWTIVLDILNNFERPDKHLKHKIAKFLDTLQKRTPEILYKKNIAAELSFQALTPTLQNLVMAATQINIKLAESEKLLSRYLSDLYVDTAENVSEMVARETLFFVNLKQETNRKIQDAHKRALESIMGLDIANFSLKAFEVLNNPMLIRSEKMPTTLDEISLSLQSAKHLLQTSILVKDTSTFPVINNQDIAFDSRLKLHSINTEIEKIINSSENPEEIAKKIRILRAAEEETRAQMGIIIPNVEIVHRQNVISLGPEDIDAVIRVVDSMINQGRILKVQSNLIRKEIEDEIYNEMIKEIFDRQTQNKKIINDLQKKIFETRSEILKQHENHSKNARESEKTLLLEMNKHGKNYGSNLQICTKAIAEVARYQKSNSDIMTINYNKQKLEVIIKKLEKNLI